MKTLINIKYGREGYINGHPITFGSEKIRNEIEGLLLNSDSIELSPEYSFELKPSNYHGQVAKIIRTIPDKPKYEIRKNDNGEVGLYLTEFNFRLATFSLGTKQEQLEINKILSQYIE